MHPQVDTSQSLRCFWIFLVPTLSSFVDYCATTPVLGGGLSPPNHTQSRTHWVNADFSDAQSDTRFEPGTLGSPVRCLDHYTTPAVYITLLPRQAIDSCHYFSYISNKNTLLTTETSANQNISSKTNSTKATYQRVLQGVSGTRTLVQEATTSLFLSILTISFNCM